MVQSRKSANSWKTSAAPIEEEQLRLHPDRDAASYKIYRLSGPAQALELVWPRGEATPIGRFLAQRGPGLHHVALRVEEPLERLVPGLRAHAIEPVGGVERSSDGRPSLFLHPATTGGVLVELVEGVPT